MTPTEPLSRRRALGFLGSAGLAVALAACNRSSDNGATDGVSAGADPTTTASTATTATTAVTTATTASTGAATTVDVGGPIPTETAGPFPADGTNGPNALTTDGIVRQDIRPSLTSAATADGVLLDIELTLADAATGQVLPGHTVYLWHCDRTGNYSLYGDVTDDSFLRGVGVADADGIVRFTSIFPAAYDGRWPHIHFEVFDALEQATTGRNAVRTSQLALPEATCDEVYATAGYESSIGNLAETSLTRDMVFSDGVDLQLATMSGDPTAGYRAQLVVGI